MDVKKEQKRLVLRKHVNAIHCTGYKRLLTGKIANVLLFNAYKDLPYNETYQIALKDFCGLIKFYSRDYKAIRNALLELITTPVEWAILSANDVHISSEWRASSLLASAIVKDATLTYSYSPVMRKLLYKPEMYGQIDIGTISDFSSVYGLNLYENCIRFKNLESTPWISLGTFRNLMGVRAGEYTIFRDFNRRVLKKAVEEVNAFSPISIEPEFKKVNRNVSEIRFLIYRKKQVERSKAGVKKQLDQNNERKMIVALLKDFGFSKNRITEVLQKYGNEYILSKVELVKSNNSFKKGKIKGVAGLLYVALRDDYQPPKSSDIFVKDKVEKSVAEREEKLQKNKAVEQKKQEYDKYIDEITRADLRKLDIKIYKGIINEYLDLLSKSNDPFSKRLIKFYNEYGIASHIFLHYFRVFYTEKYSEFFSVVPTFEEYISKKS